VSAQSLVPPGLQPYRLSHIEAEQAAVRLRELLAGVEESADVLVDRQQNRLLVQGSQSTQKLASQLLNAIDAPVLVADRRAPQTEDTEVRGYKAPSEKLSVISARLRANFAGDDRVRIAVDPRTQQIIVVAPPSIQAKITEAIKLAGSPTDASNVLRTLPPAAAVAYRLEHISWRELEDDIQRISGDRISVVTSRNGELATFSMAAEGVSEPVLQIDRRRDEVSFLGAQQSAEVWQRTVQALDSARADGPGQTELVPIRRADPGRVQRTVSLLQGESQESIGDQASVTRPRPQWGGRLVSMIFQDQNGQPLDTPAGGQDQAAPAMEGEEGGEGGGLIGNVQIEFLEGLDVIILRGNKRDVERVQKIIDDIERMAGETQPVVEVYHLQHVNSQAIATLVSELYEEILSPRQGQVAIRALVDPNALLLIGRRESVAYVKDMVVKLDEPAAQSGQFEIFRLKHVSSVDAEQTVRNFFVNRPGTDTEPRTGLGIQVQVLADFRTNSLIVQASPRDLVEVRRLIDNIDVESGDTVAELRVFRLGNALSDDLATVLQAAISGAGGQPQQQQQQQQAVGQLGGAQSSVTLPSATVEFMLIDQNGGELLRSGILSDVLVTSDPSINALLVRAPSKSMELIAALIEQLDKLPEAEAQIKVFEIVNGDATNLTIMLQQLFGQTVTAGQGSAQLQFGNFGLQQQLGTGGGETSLVPLRFAVDVRTNGIIASGSEDDLSVVEVLLLRLDEGDIETRRLSVVRLKNAPALDVSNAITSFLTSQRTLIQQQLLFNQAISPFEQIEREVIVVPEVVTNSLIVSATPRYFDEIMQVIQDLDFRPPMVMVQVVIAEVTLSDDFEYGVEFGLQDDLLFDRGIAVGDLGTPNASATPGFNFNSLGQALPNANSIGREILASQALTNFGLGRTRGGLVLSAANESINILIRALEDSGQLQVLSRPQIMTLNNQTAFVQVGQDVSRITGTTITQGIVQNNIEDVQTGLILRIQPLINDDGIVVMNIDAERSSLGSEADGTVVAIDNNGNAIRSAPINRQTAQTTVSAKTGQTVVFAGLISTTKLATQRRVPYLADVPVLGRLFEFETSNDRRSELMIIMTPYIVESDEDYELIKAMESERMSWCLADVVDMHGEVGLRGNSDLFCCDEVPTIYPHLAPFGEEFVPAPSEPGLAVPGFDDSVGGESARRGDGGTIQLAGQSLQGPMSVEPVRVRPEVQIAPDSGYQTNVTYGPTPPEVRAAIQRAALVRLPNPNQATE
jgi:type II secretion system protein D